MLKTHPFILLSISRTLVVLVRVCRIQQLPGILKQMRYYVIGGGDNLCGS